MAEPVSASTDQLSASERSAIRDILGYLNFSSGKPDPKIAAAFDVLYRWFDGAGDQPLPVALLLERHLAILKAEGSAFADSRQAERALDLVFRKVLPAYLAHHADLLFHVEPARLCTPFFVTRVAEAVLAQISAWHDEPRAVEGALAALNDFLGHRPLAVLENGRRSEPYAHERTRPVPLFIRGAGVARGPYHDVVAQALEILARVPPDMLAASHFDLRLLDELALDLRAFDQGHPVFKRTNYTFGEWDPHHLDVSGRYRRFVVRAIILDGLRDWIEQPGNRPREERVREAGAVLAGTMLMASAVSGSGPDTHSSSISLTSLLPRIARQRDAYYARLLQSMEGQHAERLRKEAHIVQQPFGRIRQHLNLYLAHYSCRQMQRAHLAWLFARMGFAEAARRQARIIPAASTRFETEMQVHMTTALLEAERGEVRRAAEAVAQATQVLHRGIDCGAIVDPWNILGFQGLFPLFAAREDAVPDPRVDRLLSIMEQLLATFTRVLCEVAARGDEGLCAQVERQFRELAAFWDRFAASTVADLPKVDAGESVESAARVARAVLQGRAAGSAAADIAFWKRHVEDFTTAKSYGTVLALLLRKQDLPAAMNLIIQWLSVSETVPLETGAFSIFPHFSGWLDLALSRDDPATWKTVCRFFDFVDANAADWLTVPSMERGANGIGLHDARAAAGSEPPSAEAFDPFALGSRADDSDDDDVLSAAYENVVYRDSAQDGHAGDTLDEPPARDETDFDRLVEPVERRMRFLVMLASGWRMAAEWAFFKGPVLSGDQPARDAALSVVTGWERRLDGLVRDAGLLLESLNSWQPSPPENDPEAIAEFDRQLHAKFALVNSVITSVVEMLESARVLKSLPHAARIRPEPKNLEDRAEAVLALVLAGDVAGVRRKLPRLLRDLSRLPLLYVPLDRGGKPREILASRNLQALLRQFLMRLPELGLLRETWHVLRTAYVMERTSPPAGMSITEFDRLLETGLKRSIECLLAASAAWPPSELNESRLFDLVERLVESYLRLWLKHSASMRLSSAEGLKEPAVWKQVRAFIRKYGADVFQPRLLSMGNLRGVLHLGAQAFLDYLADVSDPHKPLRLLEDARVPALRDDIVETLELILRTLVESFDLFLEYNSTTTQSDYGDQLHTFLDFVRLSADYERHDWNLMPLQLAHEVLARAGRAAAATAWSSSLERKMRTTAQSFLKRLKRLERQHGMRLPSVTDRLSERFVKPMALDRILALIEPSMQFARHRAGVNPFGELADRVEEYLETSSGSALEIQPWIQRLLDEVYEIEQERFPAAIANQPSPRQPPVRIDPLELRQQLDVWEQPLSPATRD